MRSNRGNMDSNALAKLALIAARDIREEICKTTGGVSLAGLQSLWTHAPAVVKKVQELGPDLAGSDKLSLAVEILCELVEVWWLPDWAIRKFAPSIIEAALGALKSKLG